MKRKTPPTSWKRIRRVLGNLAFDFTYPRDLQTIDINVTQLDQHGESFSITFDPSMPKSVAQQTNLRVIHLPSRTCNCTLLMLPLDSAHVQKCALTKDLKFIACATHALQLDTQHGKESCIIRVFLMLNNVQLSNPHSPPILQPCIDYRYFFNSHFEKGRYTGLPYFPPDPNLDVKLLGEIGIDASQIPQRIPMWFKLRDAITSSKVSKLLGEFAPRLGSVEATQFNFFASEPASGWRELTMRLGRLREPVQIACLLQQYPNLRFEEVGYVHHPTRIGRGASPDGILYDTNQTWEALPASTRDFYQKDTSINVKRGVVEFKASPNDCEFRANHIGQCLWEMMCANVVWCNLVRYQESWARDNETQRYHGKSTCKVIRVYRYEPLETKLIQHVEQAHALVNNPQAFLKLIWSPSFVALREEFAALARQCTIDATNVNIPTELIEQMLTWRDETAMATSTTTDMTNDKNDIVTRIEQRQSEAFNLYYGTQAERMQFVALASEQVQDYSLLIQEILHHKP